MLIIFMHPASTGEEVYIYIYKILLLDYIPRKGSHRVIFAPAQMHINFEDNRLTDRHIVSLILYRSVGASDT